MSRHSSIGTRLEHTWPATRVFHEAMVLLVLLCVAFFCGSAQGQCEVERLTGPGGPPGDFFGGSVSLSGSRALIGAHRVEDDIGAALVFRRDGMIWTLEDTLTAPVPDMEDIFGSRVALSQDVSVVGAPGAAAPEFQSGAAYVFRRNPVSSEWVFETQLTASDGDFGDHFGIFVAVDGDVALIGARDDENDVGPSTGSAYVFRWNGQKWMEEAKLVDPEGKSQDGFGTAVALRGDLALIGAGGNDHPDVGNGSAFVFRHDGAAWVFEAELTAFDAVGKLRFGADVSITSDVAVVGATHENATVGAAYVFRYDGIQWLEEARLTPSNPVGSSLFGSEVSLNAAATTLLVGAPFDSTMGFLAGACWLFHHDGGAWTEIARLTASNAAAGDNFGISVSLDQDFAVISSPEQVGGSGTAYIFAGLSGIDCDSNQIADACDLFNGSATDGNNNGVPDECEALGDLNGDGVVGIVDFLMLLAAWGPCPDPCPPSCSADLDGDCGVGITDFLILLGNWG